MNLRKGFALGSFIVLLVLSACQPSQPSLPTLPVALATQPPASNTPQPTAVPAIQSPDATQAPPLTFAVIGDYGQSNPDAFQVAEMIDSWHVDFIVTTGDNNYPDGSAATIDDNIGQYYHRYIGNYQGSYNRGSAENRFFPSPGNHDWNLLHGLDVYLDYFTLPGNERYYDVVQGPVHLFILDSDTHEPDGVGRSSVQAAWLQAALAASDSPWNIVVCHHPPYSSGHHGSTDWMQWPFKEWGADLVLSGHDHLYERLEVDGLTYIINGLGGHAAVYDFPTVLPESQFRYNQMHGAMLVEARPDQLRLDFYSADGNLVDSYTLSK